MAAEAESEIPVLDACAALRADLDARAASAERGPPDTRGGRRAGTATSGDETERVAAWLPLIVGLERAARLPERERPAHFRRQRAAWEAAAAVFGEPEYARIGDRLARWRSPDPRLPLVRALLWAVEQPEAVGYTRLALAGATALRELVPQADVRNGYVLVHSARAIRNLGGSQQALARYVTGEHLGSRFRDRWLSARSAIGLGSTYAHLGNYPEARKAFRRVLDSKLADPRLVAAAHHGLLISAMTAEDFDTAVDEAWSLLQAGEAGTIARADVLNLVADLCYRIGSYESATRLAEAVLRIATRPDQTVASLAVLVDVAAESTDKQLGLRYGPLLRGHIGGYSTPFEDARALMTLANLEIAVGSTEQAATDLSDAMRIADEHGYHELKFKADTLAGSIRESQGRDIRQTAGTQTEQYRGRLSDRTWDTVARFDRWSERAMPELIGRDR